MTKRNISDTPMESQNYGWIDRCGIWNSILDDFLVNIKKVLKKEVKFLNFTLKFCLEDNQNQPQLWTVTSKMMHWKWY